MLGAHPKNYDRVFAMQFASLYNLYIDKVIKKGRSIEELDCVISWLTGYSTHDIQKTLSTKVSLEYFFQKAPLINPNASKIKGTICGYKVKEIAHLLMQQIRYMDKLVDELAKGKDLDEIRRA